MAFRIPRNQTIAEALGQAVQNAMPGFVQGGLQFRADQKQSAQDEALQQLGSQFGLNLPQGINPQLGNLLLGQAQKASLDPGSAASGFTLSQGQGRFDAQGNPIASVGGGGFTLGQGQQRFDELGQPIAGVAAAQPAPQGPSAFGEKQALIEALSAIPSGERTPEQQAQLNSLIGAPPKPKASDRISQKKLDEINRLQAKVLDGTITKPQQGLLNKLLGGAAGVNINLGKSTGGERTAIAEGESTLGDLANLEQLFNNANTRTGPIVGRVDPVKGLAGFTSPEQENLMAATSAFTNRVIKAITGAQMSEREADRIKKQIPAITDPPARWRAKFKQTQRNMKQIQRERSKVLSKSGITSPLDVDVSGGEEKTNVDTISEKFGF